MAVRKQTALLFFDGSTAENGNKAKEAAEVARGHGINAYLRDYNHYNDENETADLIMVVGEPGEELLDRIKKRYGEDNVQTAPAFPDDYDDESPIRPHERTDEEEDELKKMREANGGVHQSLGRVGEGGGFNPNDGDKNHDPGKVVIPHNWREMSWAELRSLASSIKGVNVTNKTDAVTTVEEELKRRDGGDDGSSESGGEGNEGLEGEGSGEGDGDGEPGEGSEPEDGGRKSGES